MSLRSRSSTLLSTPTRNSRCSAIRGVNSMRLAIRSCCRASWRTFRRRHPSAISARCRRCRDRLVARHVERPGAIAVRRASREARIAHAAQRRQFRGRARSGACGLSRAEASRKETPRCARSYATIQNRRRACGRRWIVNLQFLVLALLGFASWCTLTCTSAYLDSSSSGTASIADLEAAALAEARIAIDPQLRPRARRSANGTSSRRRSFVARWQVHARAASRENRSGSLDGANTHFDVRQDRAR